MVDDPPIPLPFSLETLPSDSGVYLFKDTHLTIIYIGKAKHLKKRISSYFHKAPSTHSLKTRILISKIASIETIVTSSEQAALILENQLIKHHMPRYNIQLKDDKSYPYIKLTTQDPFPRIIITRQKRSDGATYFGPYASIGSSRSLRRLLYDLFPLRDCTQDIDLVSHQPKCINLDIGKCIGPCIYKDCKPAYDALIHELIDFLSGKDKQLLKMLTQRMSEASTSLNFEKAAVYRDRIHKLERLIEKQQVDMPSSDHTHVLGIDYNTHYTYVLIQDIIHGKLLYQHGLYTPTVHTMDPHQSTQQALLNFYSEHPYPDILLCPHDISLPTTDFPFTIHIPQKGVKKDLVMNAMINAKRSLYRLSKHAASRPSPHQKDRLLSLQTRLSLPKYPSTIMGFDISHYYGKDIVASSVTFKDGLPKRSDYRHFRIRSVSNTSNDPQSIYEVVLRRLSSLTQENYPDLLLIDGGKPQLSFACRALKELGLQESIPCISLAKRLEEVFIPGHDHSIRLDHHAPSLHLLQSIRDESHRFALTYQRKKRHASFLRSPLLDIPGLGPTRVKNLYQKFKSLDTLKLASQNVLAKVPGISSSMAHRIVIFLQTL